jgi:hypothetical protein
VAIGALRRFFYRRLKGGLRQLKHFWAFVLSP